MRIVVAAGDWFPDCVGGNARVATDTACGLAARGHEVVALAGETAGLPRASEEGGVLVRRVAARGALPTTLADAAAGWREASARADVVLAHSWPMATGMGLRPQRAPLAAVYHAPGLREQRFDRRRLDLKGRLAKSAIMPVLALTERLIVRRAATVLTLSGYTRGMFAADHPEAAGRARVVGGGVDVDRFAPGPGREAVRASLGVPERTVLLLTVRRLEPRMGLENLLVALGRLSDLDVHLVVAGTGSLAGSLRRLAGELELECRVTFAGRIGDDELPRYYRAADLFVLPTLAYEGFGLVTAEALAAGTPVVGTPVGATPELLLPLDPALVARGPEPQAIAEAVRAALPRLGPDLRGRCRAYALDRFGWNAVLDRWEAALHEAAAATSPPGRVSAPAGASPR